MIQVAEAIDPDVDRVNLLRDGPSEEVISVLEGVTPAHIMQREPHLSGRLVDDEREEEQQGAAEDAGQEGAVWAPRPDPVQALMPVPRVAMLDSGASPASQ